MTQATLHAVPGHEVPPGAEGSVLETTDAVALRVARWPASTTATTRGTVLLFHGYTEFIEKYYEVIQELRARGFAVATFDWRGQGLSTRLLSNPCKGHVEDYAHFLADADRVYAEVVLPDMPRPHLLLAHSMGGHLGLRFLQEFPDRFTHAVLSAPMLGWDRIPAPLLRALATAHVAAGKGGAYTWLRGDPDPDSPVNDVTTDAARFARNQAFLNAVPELRLGGPTWRWLQQAATSITRILRRDRLARVKTPVLVASAEHDTIVSSARHQLLPARSPAFTVLPVAGAKHEILQETDAIRARFWDGFDRFVG